MKRKIRITVEVATRYVYETEVEDGLPWPTITELQAKLPIETVEMMPVIVNHEEFE